MKYRQTKADRIKILLTSQDLGHVRLSFLNLNSIAISRPSTIMAVAAKYRGFNPAAASKVAFKTTLNLEILLLRIKQAKA